MASSSEITLQNGVLSFADLKASAKTDWKAVAEALNAPAELVAQHTTTAAGSRRFLLKAA